ncbi:hypothetical protein FALCPG4_016488 [Fusarium falciforme]
MPIFEARIQAIDDTPRRLTNRSTTNALSFKLARLFKSRMSSTFTACPVAMDLFAAIPIIQQDRITAAVSAHTLFNLNLSGLLKQRSQHNFPALE